MSNKIEEFCIKCNKIVIKRRVKDKRKSDYFACAACLEKNCKKYRKKYWEKYLAMKANSRKKINSELITEQNIKDLSEKQKHRCAISGVEFNIEDPQWRPSLDRIDNEKGYLVNNLQLVAWIVNRSRGSLLIEEFKNMCVLVAKTSNL